MSLLGKRKYLPLSVDLAWALLSGFAAVLIRDNLEFSLHRMASIVPTVGVTVIAAAIVFVAFGLHRSIWRYASLPDLMRIMAAVSVTILIVLFVGFAHNRLEGVARSIPLIQWVVMVGGMIGTRVFVRLTQGHLKRDKPLAIKSMVGAENVLIVGLGPLTELYIRAIKEFAPDQIAIVGILAQDEHLKGRLVQFHEVLGTPEEIRQVLETQSVHGVEISRIIVTRPFKKFSEQAQKALLAAERASNIRLDFFAEFAERLGLTSRNDVPADCDDGAENVDMASQDIFDLSQLGENEFVALGGYSYVKRAIDILGASLAFVFLSPLIALTSLVVLLDVGLPLTFPQQRPGRFGRPFRLYKFRTMIGLHDEAGKRIPESARESARGRFIRSWRLDELPQLYNILAGEMSFVGPRPLLPVDQPDWDTSRLLVRPGLTGWAQVNGGRSVSIPDKTALDVWYLVHASLWLDVKIVLKTFVMLVGGERRNREAIARAWEDIKRLRKRLAAAHDSPVAEANPGAAGNLQVDAA